MASESAGAPADVGAYIASFPSDVQRVLQEVRRVVRTAAPDARELMSYRMPALKLNGMLLYYGAFKHHIGFFPPVRGDAALEVAAAPYAGEKGNLRFPLDAPMPLELIARLTHCRVEQDRAKAAAKPRRRRA